MGLFDFLKNEKPVTVQVGDQVLTASKESLAYSQLGIDKYQAGDFRGAAVAFSESIKAMPTNAALYVWRGTAYEDSDNITAAEKDFVAALKLDPTDFLAAYRLGMIYSDRQDRANAAKWLKHAYDNALLDVADMKHVGWSKNCLFFVGKQIIAHNLGIQYIETGSPEVAIPYFEHAVRIEPEYANAHFGIGVAHYNLGKKDKALTFFSKAAKLGHAKASTILNNWEH